MFYHSAPVAEPQPPAAAVSDFTRPDGRPFACLLGKRCCAAYAGQWLPVYSCTHPETGQGLKAGGILGRKEKAGPPHWGSRPGDGDEGQFTVTDTPATIIPTGQTPKPGTLGFLTVLHDPGGVLGGYLVTNAWGRPLEFRLTTAVQPTKVQQVLYGPTLTEYLCSDLIGKALVEKTSTLPGLILTDSVPALGLRAHIDVPVIALAAETVLTPDLLAVPYARSAVTLVIPARFAADRPTIEARLAQIDPAVDLSEPFTRVREAVAEARKMGVAARAA